MSGDGDGYGQLGANVGFGYLNDDDDDAAGGGVPIAFDVISGGTFGVVATGSAWGQTFAAKATGGAQTNGTFTVFVTLPSNDWQPPTTAALAGWTETGWTNTSGPVPYVWQNVFTLAALTSGTEYDVQVQVNENISGTVSFQCNIGAPKTDQATGVGFGIGYAI